MYEDGNEEVGHTTTMDPPIKVVYAEMTVVGVPCCDDEGMGDCVVLGRDTDEDECVEDAGAEVDVGV